MYERNYHSNTLKKDSKKKSNSKTNFSWKKFFKIVFILIIIAGVFFLLRNPKLQVNDIKVSGVEVIDAQDLKSKVTDLMTGKYLWLIPRSSIFLVQERKLEENIRNDFPRIENITIKRSSFHTLAIEIKEFDAAYIWCTRESTDCYFMDKTGVVYSTAPTFSGTAYSKIISDKPVESLPFQAIDIDKVNQITEIQDRLSAINITTVAFDYVSEHKLVVDFLHNKSTAQFLIDPLTNTDDSLEYIFSGIRTEPLSSKFHNPNKKLLYIDVRFSSKVVYKFQEE